MVGGDSSTNFNVKSFLQTTSSKSVIGNSTNAITKKDYTSSSLANQNIELNGSSGQDLPFFAKLNEGASRKTSQRSKRKSSVRHSKNTPS